MGRIFKSPWAWFALLAVLLFLVSGLLMRGNVLNESIPGNIFGWLFWSLCALLAWYFLISPLISFWRLPKWEIDCSSDDYTNLKFLKRYAEEISETASKNLKDHKVIKENLNQVERALNTNGEVQLKLLRESVSMLRVSLSENVCGEIISKYMKYAAVSVTVSQRGFLDSLIVFAVQVKLITELSRVMGHKPSWSFISCCMFWVLSNSLISMIFDDTEITETLLSSVSEVLGLKASGLLGDIPGLKAIANISAQAITASGSVYVTGALVRDKLLGDFRKKTIKELLGLRIKAYEESAKVAKNVLFGEKSTSSV